MVNKCKICGREFIANQKTEIYCTAKCSIEGQKLRAKERSRKTGLVKTKCICCSGKGYVYQNYQNTQKDQIRKVVGLYKKGFGIREIQRKLKIRSPYTVTYYLRKANAKFAPKLQHARKMQKT